ncbi:MAG TPA: TrbG/VirB9 family P-type conjugative transfer protein [Steroidobacteraceae bacterium]|nr:TrbG/VirB9 family P-type conjugative transfer protein [Steroidobacteraceae bacterium]
MRCSIGLLVGLGTWLVTTAAEVPPPGVVDPRVREIAYRPDQVVSLTAYAGYHIDLELEAGERLVALGAGDSAAVDAAAEGSHVLLKPKAAPLATNLTLVSSRRVYHFEYRAFDAAPSPATAIFALRFRYPAAPATLTPATAHLPPAASDAAEATKDPPTIPVPARPLNTDYWFCGSPWLRPVRATDDGVQTRITFDARGEWPAIFVENADGSESLVNFHADGTTAVVHRVAAKFVLRRGRLVACVENRGYAGSGAWVAGGALDPVLKREVRP